MPYDLNQIEQQIADLRNQLAPLQKYTEQPTGAEFSEALRGKMTEPEDVENLIKRIAESRSRMLAIPAETRAQQQPGLFSPTQVSSLIEQRQEPVRTQWETFMGMKQAREGQLQDVIKGATELYTSKITAAEKKYNRAYQELQDLISQRNWITQQTQPQIFGGQETGYYGQSYNPQTQQWETKQVAAGAPTTGTTGVTGLGTTPKAMVQTPGGESLDLGTTEGLKRAGELGYSYEYLRVWLDENTKLNLSSIDYMLEEAGLLPAKEIKARSEDEATVKRAIEAYKPQWAKLGDAAGTREQLAGRIAESVKALTYGEILNIVYQQIPDAWLRLQEQARIPGAGIRG